GKMRESCSDVGDFVRDVMHPRPALREEATDRRVVVERSQELEPTLPDPDRRRLDALLLDPRSVLEPGDEQALVGVERAVQILDRETDVVDRVGRLHLAIVFESLAAPMRVSTLALVLTAALLAGCGGSKSTAKPNGEASKPPATVLANARAAATSATS